MDLREQRGVVLAATKKISRYGERWKVPSATNDGFYMVSHINGQEPVCSCPDWETRRQKCKHIYAAIYVMRREEHSDGTTTVTETLAVATERPTYPQEWHNYNAAQTNEKSKFQSLLTDLCRTIPQTQVKRAGRPQVRRYAVYFVPWQRDWWSWRNLSANVPLLHVQAR